MGVDVRSDGGLDRIPRRQVHAQLTEREKNNSRIGSHVQVRPQEGNRWLPSRGPYLHEDMHWFGSRLFFPRCAVSYYTY